MDFVLHFEPVLARWPDLLAGLRLTLVLSGVALVGGLALAAVGASLAVYGPRPARAAVRIFVEAIRNTPFLIQLYLVFFALPGIGLRLGPGQAAALAMTINFAGYAIEILRAGILNVPTGQIEAGRALGLPTYRIVRHVVLLPALRAVYPALASQFVLQLLGSSIVAAIAAEELTAVANNLAMQTFRNFEVYIVVGVIYFALALGFRSLFGLGRDRAFRWAT